MLIKDDCEKYSSQHIENEAADREKKNGFRRTLDGQVSVTLTPAAATQRKRIGLDRKQSDSRTFASLHAGGRAQRAAQKGPRRAAPTVA
jgi:hypothetical protein